MKKNRDHTDEHRVGRASRALAREIDSNERDTACDRVDVKVTKRWVPHVSGLEFQDVMPGRQQHFERCASVPGNAINTNDC